MSTNFANEHTTIIQLKNSAVTDSNLLIELHNIIHYQGTLSYFRSNDAELTQECILVCAYKIIYIDILRRAWLYHTVNIRILWKYLSRTNSQELTNVTLIASQHDDIPSIKKQLILFHEWIIAYGRFNESC